MIHFIRFTTDRMQNFINLVKNKGLAQISSTVCATGGGAIKFSKEAESELAMKFHKADELESLIRGIEFIAKHNLDECYYYDNPLNEGRYRKIIW